MCLLYQVRLVAAVDVDPSPVLRLTNIITLEDLEEDDDYEALLEDLREGCSQFGSVLSLHVPRIRVGLLEGIKGSMEARKLQASDLLLSSIHRYWKRLALRNFCGLKRSMGSKYRWITIHSRCIRNR